MARMPQVTHQPAFGSAVETNVQMEDVARRLADGVAPALDGRPADICLLFASAHFEDQLADIAERIPELLPARAFIGVTTEAVLHGEHEYENQPAIALWAAQLGDADVVSFHLSQADLDRMESPEELAEYLQVDPASEPSLLLTADPFTINPMELIDQLNNALPGRPIIGGLATAADQPGQNCVVFDGETLRHGAAGIAISGVRVDTLVSQGCRPIGDPLVITRAERNVIHELGGKPARQAFRTILNRCPARDMELARQGGLLIGRVINEQQARFDRGDFLIRQFRLVPHHDAIVVGDLVRPGQTVQFHVQEAKAATDDLETLLELHATEPVGGALAFTCNGRGSRLFNRRHHDARAVADAFGAIPTAGMFCGGEIGPVGASNFLHGHAASIALFRPAARDARG